MLQAIVRYLRPPPICDVAALQRFLSGEASYLAQRSTYEFSRNTLAWFGQWAFGDEKFNDAFRFCRWEAFAAVLADMVVLTHARLAPHDGGRPDLLAAQLTRLYESILLEYPLPAHRPAGWPDVTEALRGRLVLAPSHPLEPGDVARVAARRIDEIVPVHSSNPEEDYKAIEGAIRFGIVSFHDRLVQRVRPAQVAGALLARAEAAVAAAG